MIEPYLGDMELVVYIALLNCTTTTKPHTHELAMDNLDDDYIAHLLKSEAKSKASDYNQRGVRALLPTR